METKVNFMGVPTTPDEKELTQAVKIEKEQHPRKGEILDIHTHHTQPQPHAVISLRIGPEQTLPELLPEQLYSTGIHPWDTMGEISEDDLKKLDKFAELPQIVAIGEAGADLNLQGVPMYRQLQVFKHQIELSERLGKPLVIHDVKAHDIVVGLKKDLQPKQNWLIHGFRGKPEVAYMLMRPGIYFSFGPNFNADTLKEMPEDIILAETDESELDIFEVIRRISQVRGKDMTEVIAANTRRFLNKE